MSVSLRFEYIKEENPVLWGQPGLEIKVEIDGVLAVRLQGTGAVKTVSVAPGIRKLRVWSGGNSEFQNHEFVEGRSYAMKVWLEGAFPIVSPKVRTRLEYA